MVEANIQIPDRKTKDLITSMASEVPTNVEESAKIDVGSLGADVQVRHVRLWLTWLLYRAGAPVDAPLCQFLVVEQQVGNLVQNVIIRLGRFVKFHVMPALGKRMPPVVKVEDLALHVLNLFDHGLSR